MMTINQFNKVLIGVSVALILSMFLPWVQIPAVGGKSLVEFIALINLPDFPGFLSLQFFNLIAASAVFLLWLILMVVPRLMTDTLPHAGFTALMSVVPIALLCIAYTHTFGDLSRAGAELGALRGFGLHMVGVGAYIFTLAAIALATLGISFLIARQSILKDDLVVRRAIS